MKSDYNHIQLINAPLDKIYIPGIRNGAYPPLNLAYLSSALKKDFPEMEVEILDGEILGEDEITSLLKSPIVGISCNSLSYNSALRIAQAAKKNESIVVLGGPHPTFNGMQIIKNRKEVDFVVVGDGEKSLVELVRGSKLDNIPNLIYRNGQRIDKTSSFIIPINKQTFPDYGELTMQIYFRNYRELYNNKPFKKPFASFSSKGCQWRKKTNGGCSFCSIPHLGFDIKDPILYWNELLFVHERYGADFFWDVSDTFTMQKEWVHEFTRHKPQRAKFKFQVYGRASDIDNQLIEDLSTLNVYEIFLGLESGSNTILKNSKKGQTKKINMNAIKNLCAGGIKPVISIILGLEGENWETVFETEEMVNEILSVTELDEINISLVLPLPGSKMFNKINKFIDQESDTFDPILYRELWFKHFTELEYKDLIEVQTFLSTLNKRVGTFGLTEYEKEIATDFTTLTDNKKAGLYANPIY